MKEVLIISVVALGLNGCAQDITGTDAVKVASAIGHIEPSRKDTCETQRDIAAQSSRIDSIINDKETVYKAPPCSQNPVPAYQPPPTS